MLNNVPMVRAGDVLLVCFEKQQTQADTERFEAELRDCLPGVRLAFLEGVTGLAVFRPDDQPTDPDM
ncbi:hypothetical protein [Streptomyces sp. NPDC093060]|uniref:hypothetical protein n=1 Tax=Streptomyces sp. NPDC093060 TaxID=3366019 RepID=UPI0037F8EA7B